MAGLIGLVQRLPNLNVDILQARTTVLRRWRSSVNRDAVIDSLMI